MCHQHADVVQQRDEAHAEGVEQAVQQQDAGEQCDGVDGCRRQAELQLEQCVQEERRAEVDACGDRDLAQEVEPAGEPGPRRSVARRELGRPVVESARGRIARAHLGHREPDEQRHHADQRPAPDDQGRPTGVHAVAVQRQAPRENRDDGERDGEVRERRQMARELLRVAELVQPLGVRLAARPVRGLAHRPRHPLRRCTLAAPSSRGQRASPARRVLSPNDRHCARTDAWLSRDGRR